MAVQANLAVPYHQQDNDHYCGSACAQMVIESIGGGIVDQATLYSDSGSHTSEPAPTWYTPPDGLQWVLNDRRPSGFGGWFALYPLGTEDAISRKLAWTIHHYQVAPIALVFGGNHWVVVRGYQASAHPSSSSDTGYTISAFEINNPAPPVPSPSTPPPPPPPPHSAGDGCGTGGVRGTPNIHVAYGTWQSTYMTGNTYGTAWNGKYVAVCDPDPPAERIGEQLPGRDRLPGDRLIEPREAIELAMAGVRQFGLLERKDWSSVFERTEPSPGHLVQRLDVADSFYCLVPFVDERGVAAVVDVDGRFGNYRQAMALPEGERGLFPVPDTEQVLETTLGRRFDSDDRRISILVREEAFSLYPMLVWRPCLESLTPFLPFHMITVGDERIFVRVDGTVFTQLHTHIPGV